MDEQEVEDDVFARLTAAHTKPSDAKASRPDTAHTKKPAAYRDKKDSDAECGN